jgi:transketolase
MNQELLSQAATMARGLAIDAVHASNSGHLGLPLGTAEIGAVLFGHALQYYPDEPRWINRDRFVLSAGHGSMFLYAWLHLAGYDLPLDEIKRFRQLHSHTPGHPEFREAPGIEATTGPLGQGVGNAVGYAVSAKMLAARFNTPQHTILDYHVIALTGDGCMQEGVASEASALAGHLGLDNLILIYDSNDVTLDAMARVTQSEDTAKRFEAYGFDVVTIDGHDMPRFLEAFERARREDNGKPKLIIAKTEIGRGIPEVAGTSKAHGEGGAKYAKAARQALGLPEEPYYISQTVREYFVQHRAKLQQRYAQWQAIWNAWREVNADSAAQLQDLIDRRIPENLAERIPTFADDYADATRSAGGVVIQALAKELPGLVTGSADLFGSTKNYIQDAGDFTRDNPLGRNIWFGIREHAMGAVLNGIAYDGLLLATGATFTVFADYLRPAIRLAALSHLPVVFILTHDSVGVGEDGPTHQPVETCSGLRVIPGLDVSRPADPEEVAGAFAAALERSDGPTALLLTRQKVPTLSYVPAATRREGAQRGGYVVVRETEPLACILIASGSEVAIAIEAARQLGPSTRVVSLPCWERFERQSEEYRQSVLPASCRKRVAVEAGVTGLWWKYVGDQGQVVGIDRFGLSAPGDQVLRELGITVEHVVVTARRMG